MPLIYLPELRLHAHVTGPENGAPLLLIHGLGQDHQLWQSLCDRLPGHRILSYDLRGHGASDCPPAPYSMGSLIRDAERLCEHIGLKETVVIGHGLGGLVAQGLAVKRLDLVRGLVLSHTAARIGFSSQWQDRIAKIREGGMAALHDQVMERWFGRAWRDAPGLEAVSARFLATPAEGWTGCAAALSGSDFYQTTATLRLPCLALAGTGDGATPADLVRETAELIPGHRFGLIRGADHLPMLGRADEYANAIKTFLSEIGHI